MPDYPAELPIRTIDQPIHATIRVPGSKSITNRALVLSALCGKEATLTGSLRSEDTEVMVDSLSRLGFHVNCDWPTNTIHLAESITGRKVLATQADLFVANSGTSMRFLAALVATGEGRYRLDGVPRMRERPIQDLLDALAQLGVKAWSEAGNGCPPIIIESQGLRGGVIRMKADISSQFASAILMAAPFAKDNVTLVLDGPVVSEPYLEMTLAMMRLWGLPFERDGSSIIISAGNHAHHEMSFAIEPDASAASYFLAAGAIAGGRVVVPDLHANMLQGDTAFVHCLNGMGCKVSYGSDGIVAERHVLRGRSFDMNSISDTVMTLAAVACFAEGPTAIRNVAHIRHKETDRIAALATELRKLGVGVDEFEDGLRITPRSMTGCKLMTYDDHRMAMSLALIGLLVPGVIIDNPGCVAKTFPGFWQDFDRLYSIAS